MLDEKLHLLEEKVMILLDELKRQRDENAALKSRVAELEPEAADAVKLRTERADLQETVRDMENEAVKQGQKEQEIRERLRTIIEKIDSIEALAAVE